MSAVIMGSHRLEGATWYRGPKGIGSVCSRQDTVWSFSASQEENQSSTVEDSGREDSGPYWGDVCGRTSLKRS